MTVTPCSSISERSALDNLAPWRQLDLATLEHSGVVGKMLASVKRAHHGFSVGEDLLNEPVTLQNGLAALVTDDIAEVIDRPSETGGFSVQNKKSVFHRIKPRALR